MAPKKPAAAEEPKSTSVRHSKKDQSHMKSGISKATATILARRGGCASVSNECKEELMSVFDTFTEKLLFRAIAIKGAKKKVTMRHLKSAMKAMGMSIVGLSNSSDDQEWNAPKRLKFHKKKQRDSGAPLLLAAPDVPAPVDA